MSETLNLLIGLAMGLNLLALGSSRLPSIIRATAVQGMALGLLPLVLEHDFNWQIAVVALATAIGKGLVIPGLLRRAMRAANIEREIEPFIGSCRRCCSAPGGRSQRWRSPARCRCCRSTRARSWCPARSPPC